MWVSSLLLSACLHCTVQYCYSLPACIAQYNIVIVCPHFLDHGFLFLIYFPTFVFIIDINGNYRSLTDLNGVDIIIYVALGMTSSWLKLHYLSINHRSVLYIYMDTVHTLGHPQTSRISHLPLETSFGWTPRADANIQALITLLFNWMSIICRWQHCLKLSKEY